MREFWSESKLRYKKKWIKIRVRTASCQFHNIFIIVTRRDCQIIIIIFQNFSVIRLIFCWQWKQFLFALATTRMWFFISLIKNRTTDSSRTNKMKRKMSKINCVLTFRVQSKHCDAQNKICRHIAPYVVLKSNEIQRNEVVMTHSDTQTVAHKPTKRELKIEKKCKTNGLKMELKLNFISIFLFLFLLVCRYRTHDLWTQYFDCDDLINIDFVHALCCYQRLELSVGIVLYMETMRNTINLAVLCMFGDGDLRSSAHNDARTHTHDVRQLLEYVYCLLFVYIYRRG